MLGRMLTSKELTNEFPEKSWTKRDVNKLLKKLENTGTVDRRPGSGGPCSAHTEENVDTVNDLVLNQIFSLHINTPSIRSYARRGIKIGVLKMQFVCIFFHVF